MKKGILIGVIAIVTIAAIVCGVVFLGGNKTPKVEVSSSADVLNKVVSTYAEEEKFFSMGGNIENAVENAPGIYSLENKEAMIAELHVTEDLIAQIDEAGSFSHAMNANTFTSAAFHLTDAKNAQNFASSLRESIQSTQWMCGFPDKLVIYTINGGDYVVYALGSEMNVSTFSQRLVAAYGEAAVEVANEAVAV